jgi:hypothetical protein
MGPESLARNDRNSIDGNRAMGRVNAFFHKNSMEY